MRRITRLPHAGLHRANRERGHGFCTDVHTQLPRSATSAALPVVATSPVISAGRPWRWSVWRCCSVLKAVGGIQIVTSALVLLPAPSRR